MNVGEIVTVLRDVMGFVEFMESKIPGFLDMYEKGELEHIPDEEWEDLRGRLIHDLRQEVDDATKGDSQ